MNRDRECGCGTCRSFPGYRKICGRRGLGGKKVASTSRAKSHCYDPLTSDEIQAQQKVHYESHIERRKAYYEAHKEKIKSRSKAQSKAYYESHREQRKAYYEAHKEKIKSRSKAYHESHREQIKAYWKAYHESHREKTQKR